MRARIGIAIEEDLSHPKKFAVMAHTPGNSVALGNNMSRVEANRMLIPLRRAFMAGMEWMRQDIVEYGMSVHPDVVCELARKP